MAFRKNRHIRNEIVIAIRNNLNGGVLTLRTGGQPVAADDPPTGTLLCTIQLPNPSFSGPDVGANEGLLTLTGTWSGVSSASGVAGWARIVGLPRPSGYPWGIVDVSVGGSGSGADMIIDNTSIATGATINVIGFTIFEHPG